ncbi:MAG: leucine-rich repeat domain-containing protein [Clostridia bacterium]|nr:leucine-rich repeat domain-containing protein [Clostridia bacterium]
MKKTFRIVLISVFVLFFVSIAFIAFRPFLSAGKFFDGCYLLYSPNEDGKTCTVTKCIPLWKKEVSVPETIGRYRVSAIGDYAFANRSKIKNISLPNSLCEIGMGAFYECTNLADIRIPQNVTAIGSYAFYGCEKLTDITIPESVTAIGAGALDRCTGLLSVNIPTLAIPSLPSENNITSVIINSGKSIGNLAFRNFKSLTSITIAPSVEMMGENVFVGCKNIASATVPTCAIAELPKNALTRLTVNGGTEIPERACLYATNLMCLTLGESIQTINPMAFSGCYKLVEVYNFSSLTLTLGATDNGYVARYALNIYTSKEETTKTWIDENGYLFFEDAQTCYLLGYMGDLTELVLPTDCNGKSYIIHRNAFYNNQNLTSISFSDGVVGIDGYAFYHCSGLQSIHLPDGLLQIGEYAFADCEELTEISLPKNISVLGTFAFEDCDSLARVEYRGTTKEWSFVKQGYSWISYTPADAIVCTDGVITLN